MKSNNKPENQPVAQEKKRAVGTAAHGIEGPKTKGGPGPKIAPTDPTNPVSVNPNEQPKG
jgi:hypothetical protein